MELLIKLRSVWINKYEENVLHLYGFILSSGSIESDKYNCATENFEKRPDN